jgi:hypothetical protein
MDKRDKVGLLISFINPAEEVTKVMKRKIDLFRSTDEGFEEAKAEVLANIKERYDEYIERQIDVYSEMLSDESIDASIAFYTSPQGQEIVSKLPKVNDRLSEFTSILAMQVMQAMTPLLEYCDPEIGEEDY